MVGEAEALGRAEWNRSKKNFVYILRLIICLRREKKIHNNFLLHTKGSWSFGLKGPSRALLDYWKWLEPRHASYPEGISWRDLAEKWKHLCIFRLSQSHTRFTGHVRVPVLKDKHIIVLLLLFGSLAVFIVFSLLCFLSICYAVTLVGSATIWKVHYLSYFIAVATDITEETLWRQSQSLILLKLKHSLRHDP
jgi:hypothetical protein